MTEFEKRELIEKAVNFITTKFQETKKELTKPVLFHSLNIGFYLYKKGYSVNAVLAGLLHDTTEDTQTTLEEITEIFGKEVTDLVDANSKREGEKTREMIGRCIALGEEALIVKAADVMENTIYSKKQRWEVGIEYSLKAIPMILEKKPENFKDPIFGELGSLLESEN